MLEGGNARLSREERIKRLQALAGQYIALAHAVQPAKEVYLASLRRSEVRVTKAHTQESRRLHEKGFQEHAAWGTACGVPDGS